MARIELNDLIDLSTLALVRAGASLETATATSKALGAAEAQGLTSHGVSRVPQYASHIRLGRVDGNAIPKIVRSKGAAALIDAADGLAFPACALAITEAIGRANDYGVAFVGITNSHHFGIASYHLEPVAAVGMVGLAFSNSPAAMPAWGGKRPIFGTNPIAAVFPRNREIPIVVDLSLSQVARGKLMVADSEGKAIPLGWALDRDGNPTTNPRQGLDGMMVPAGGVKGAMLALVVELLCCALTGAHLGFEADSFFTNEGNRPRIGQAFIVIDPRALSDTDIYVERVETLVDLMLQDDDVRLPGRRRSDLAREAAVAGVVVSDYLLEQLRSMGSA